MVKKSIYKENKSVKKDRGKKRRRILNIIAIILLVAGIYQLLLIFSPNYSYSGRTQDIQKAAVASTYDAVLIPKIGVDIAFKSGDESVLNDNSWWRYPERGNPEKGGNFILSAHRFRIGLTPGETIRNSPFYHVDKLNVGDKIIIRYDKKIYNYKITKKYDVKPTQVEIEAPSKEAKLTLYTCSLGGSADGRVVIEAKRSGDATPIKKDKK